MIRRSRLDVQVGKVIGTVLALVLAAAIFVIAAPGDTAAAACAPVTLDQLYPGFDIDGNPIPTTTTTVLAGPTETTQPTVPDGATSSVSDIESSLHRVCRSWTYPMTYPVVYDAPGFSSFGADRDGGARLHRGVDIPAPKMTPVVAIADGEVTVIRAATDDCCWVMITHADGWRSLYVHLNNDTHGTDDGNGTGVNPRIEEGSFVEAGQVIGWVGDSGNAEESVPHLHFELRSRNGFSVDPGPSLKKAFNAVEFGTTAGPYVDDDGTEIEALATWMVSRGAFWPCDDKGLELCPTRLAGPIGTVALMEQITDLTPPSVTARRQDVAIEAFVPGEMLSDIFGCEFVDSCMLWGVSAGDLARQVDWLHRSGWTPDFTTRTLEESQTSTAPGSESLAVDTPLFDLATAEAGLRQLGALGECHSGPDESRLVNRAETLVLLNWWLNLAPPIPCRQGFDPDV